MDALHALTLGDVLRQHSRSRPRELALVCGADRIDYAGFEDRVNRFAHVLADSGIAHGDRVLWLGQNCHRLLEGMLAAAKVGAVFCPVNWRQSAGELAWVIEHADPTVVVWQAEQIEETVRAAREQATSDARWIQHDGDYEDLIASAESVDVEWEVDPASPALMLYTAAFEGRPRGALLSHTALLYQSLVIALVQRIDHTYRYLNAGPLFHMATLMTTLATFHLGGRNVFTRRSDAEEMCRLIDAERCTGAFLLHPTVQKMAEVNADGRYDLSSLVTMRMGVPGFDDAIADEVTPWIRRPGGYGQTEVTGLATLSAMGDTRMPSGTVSPVAQVRVVDEDGVELPAGEVGEIVVRGPIAMAGYHGDPEATAHRQRGGWHHTNDLGRYEADGALTFVGPRTVLIKSGAENIYPAEVEAAVAAHPAVREAAVIGVPDATWGQNVKAVVVLHAGQDVSADDLIEHCRERIASYKKPKEVVFVDALPRTSSGQVDRAALDAAHGGGGYPGRGMQD